MKLAEILIRPLCIISITMSVALCFKTIKRDAWTFRFYAAGAFLMAIECMLKFVYLANTEMRMFYMLSEILKEVGAGLGFISLSLRISSFLPKGPFTFRIFSYHYPMAMAVFWNLCLVAAIILRDTNVELNNGLIPGTLSFYMLLGMGTFDILYALYLCQLAYNSRSDKNSENQKVLNQMALLFLLKLCIIILTFYFFFFSTELLTDSFVGMYYATDGIFLYIFRKMTVHRVKQEKLVETNYASSLLK
jgi:hypothetical protein